jgi:hypothetical protein
MAQPRWRKIMEATGCREAHARTAACAIEQLRQAKGAAMSLPPEVASYIGHKMVEDAAEVFERIDDNAAFEAVRGS